ncbi:NADH-quinone oxidoreductase subunit NuoE [Acidithiobacillus thiooxidans]|uniref:NADH-quinone oxidoreductase subunit E n=1 Tax=Acidithiobacillus thiooxidans ATCC 19377 TaxID=637390 RepID=A0A543Q1D2_ACITH|nr:NADH-quinone oxidoreductase subunit NuoE [Acidithiobacillus thiooxidans]MDR7925724.1 NADH-quinone oxidoreductase subunit NuoE [Acidithiobacillus thiooxidans]MDX5933145.1 NADH-quinone oxidoreductase subunit NuoE [Acidithiobacillus thiooxidans]TQN50141.1 NADH-quinone oxidoreductase subunit E [Acidithiobacillus thiooxidans ATCC 19377]
MLSEKSLKAIAFERSKYPQEEARSALLAALRIAQEEQGYLRDELIEYVAEILGLPAIQAFEVATFYTMYDLKPVGRHKLCVCGSVSCFLNGSDRIIAHLSRTLGIGLGETTADGLFTLQEVECLGACKDAPMMQLGDRYYENLTPESLDALIAQLRGGSEDVR